jgi:hypothetical protein
MIPRRLTILIVLIVFCTFIAKAEQSNPPASPTTAPAPTAAPSPKVKAVDVPPKCKQPLDSSGNNEQANDKLCEAGIGDTIIIDVDHLPKDPEKLVLYLGGRPLTGVSARLIDNRLAFDLKRTEGSSSTWSALLAKPNLHPLRPETVSVGYDNQPAFEFFDPKYPPKINLRVYHPYWAAFSLIGLLLTLGLFVALAKRTGVIRDSSPPLATATTRPYSLSRTQAAFWFFLVIGSFIFLYMITGDYNTVTEQALILMGIGTGTALGAAMIDATKTDTANDQLSQLNPQRAQLQAELAEIDGKIPDLTTRTTAANATDVDKQALSDAKVQQDTKQAQLDEINKKINDASSGLSKPTSEGFGRDLLTDVNGINFHRFQMLVWTIVLGFLFCAGVYTTLAMPEFSTTLLALMGISAGTYLGFKIPERQN